MIIWSGVGVFVALTVFLSALFANFITDILTGGTSDYWNSHKWPLGVALIISAGVCFVLQKYVVQKEESKTLIEKETGKEIVLKNRHTFFFIAIKYWAHILSIIGLILIMKDAVAKLIFKQ